MKYAPTDPAWPDRDRFVLSAGHASMLLYSMLHLSGYDVSLDDLRAFRQWGSKTAGHPEHGHVPGAETTTGPLGQGLGNAVGMALAERMLAARFNRPGHAVVDHRTWVIASDGDLMEGVSHEAASLAGHLGLEKLCVFWDDNRITIDGATDLAFSEDVAARFSAYGWNVLHVEDGSDWEACAEAAETARRVRGRPTLVVVRTNIGHGSPNKQGTSAAHGAPLGAEEVRLTKRALGWPEDASFLVPDDVRAHMREAGRRGGSAHTAWQRRLEVYAEAFPAEARAWEAAICGRLPAGLDAALPSFEPGAKIATRKASGMAIAAIAPLLPELVGGSADLAESNNTAIPGSSSVTRHDASGRTLHFGVREHGMGAILNGMALHGGWRPFGATFLVFSDYMRPSIRLAALMKLPVIYVFTHDSIGLGEDGPTHQPVEHLASLRAMPGLVVLRPADANETSQAWRVALRTPGPVALVLTRQNLTVLDRAHLGSAAGVEEGAYVLSEPEGEPDVVLMASGSEVELVVRAAEMLATDGIRARVVSFPSFELFAQRTPEQRERVLGPPGTPRVAVEAAASQGWHRWAGEAGRCVTLDRFGASAPGARVMKELGFTPEAVAQAARDAVAPLG
jgi:transketolase